MKELIRNTVQIHRKADGYTQEELAKLVGVTRQTIIAIEKGNYVPSVALALRLAHTFKKPTEEIFTLN
jgi:putative transcriptional regulator